jgi:hypothetical protein
VVLHTRPTAAQLELARQLNVDITPGTTYWEAYLKINQAQPHARRDAPATDAQHELARKLGIVDYDKATVTTRYMMALLDPVLTQRSKEIAEALRLDCVLVYEGKRYSVTKISQRLNRYTATLKPCDGGRQVIVKTLQLIDSEIVGDNHTL